MCRRKQPLPTVVDDAEEQKLDAERYADLPESTEDDSSTPHANNDEDLDDSDSARAPAASIPFGAVHFSFGGQPAAQPAQRPTPPEIVAFAAGWLTELAPGSALPQAFKQHQV